MLSLGIGFQHTHDSSACIAHDGEILFAVAEERLSRKKHDGRFPVNAVRACLEHAKAKANDLDYICFGWPSPGVEYRHTLKTFVNGRFPFSYAHMREVTGQYVRMTLQKGGMNQFTQQFGPTRAQTRFVQHHIAHALSTYALSGFKEATVVVIDGRGAWEATSIWHGRDGALEHVQTIQWPNSLGVFYAEFTHYLGFQKNSDEWKVMGLAPYGTPGVNLREFIIPDDSPYWINSRRLLGRSGNDVSGIEELLGPRREPESEIDQRCKDLAFAVQDACETAMMQVVRLAIEKTGCRNLCLAGGVALNSKANGKIFASGMVDNIFIQPASADDGVALGAALAPYLETDHCVPVHKMRQAYLGPEYSAEEIARVLQTYKLRHTRLSDPANTGAELLADGKIIGWFQGRAEFGPRALGNRSILADPRDPEMKDKVNNAVKFRESWRPFAPSLPTEAVSDYVEKPCDSPFMILTFQVRDDKRDVIPAVTHLDGSGRFQTVDEDVNPVYWRLLKAFEARTKVPVIMNTSFNLRGEAMVCSPTDAIRTFYSSGMDALVLGNYLVLK
jgi:carbamoyltransferase